jgi:hypothetical protein
MRTEAERSGFRQSLLSFDKLLDTHATQVAKATAEGNWLAASQSAVDRLLDLGHASRFDQIEAAARALGKRIEIRLA